DFTGALFGQRGDVVVGDDHRLAVVGFVGPGDVPVFDDLAIQLAHPLVADATVVLGMHLMELDVVVLGGAVHLDRHIDESERDRTLPDGAHGVSMPIPSPAKQLDRPVSWDCAPFGPTAEAVTRARRKPKPVDGQSNAAGGSSSSAW